MASQAFLSEGRAPWGKMQSIFATIRYFGGGENLAWICQYAMTAIVAVGLVALWRSRVRYSIKAAAVATGTLLATPYLFLYDVMVLAVPIAFLIRIGLNGGFYRGEISGLSLAFALLFAFPFVGAPTGFAATVVVAVLLARRCGLLGALPAKSPSIPVAPLHTI